MLQQQDLIQNPLDDLDAAKSDDDDCFNHFQQQFSTLWLRVYVAQIHVNLSFSV